MWNSSLKEIKTFRKWFKNYTFCRRMECSKSANPTWARREMDDKQLNESLTVLILHQSSKQKGRRIQQVLVNFVFFWTYLRNGFVKICPDILPIRNDFKSSSLNGRRFHFHSRFEPIGEFVVVRRKSMFTYVVDEDVEFSRLILSFQFIKELKMNFLFR